MKPEQRLSDLESAVMAVVWDLGACTADEVRAALAPGRPLKESTVRTLLRRIEAKGYLTHDVEGRTYRYRPLLPAPRAAARAVGRIVDRFCKGSVEELLLGMAGEEMLDPDELRRLARRIEQGDDDG